MEVLLVGCDLRFFWLKNPWIQWTGWENIVNPEITRVKGTNMGILTKNQKQPIGQ